MAQDEILIKTSDQIEGIRKANQLVADILLAIEPYVVEGATTQALDERILTMITEEGAISGSLNYGNPPFPGASCISLNHVVCHGIPSERQLKKGDIVNIDICLKTSEGYFGDSSRMFCVGEVSIMARRLVEATLESMMLGIDEVRPEAPFRNIGRAIENNAHKYNYSVVREFCGHGVGLKLHEPPFVLHYNSPMVTEIMKPGMIFTIEPMINAGKRGTKVLRDGWTAVTQDKSLSAQWELAILVTDTGHEILTVPTQGKPWY